MQSRHRTSFHSVSAPGFCFWFWHLPLVFHMHPKHQSIAKLCPSWVHCSLTDLCTHDHHSVTICSVPGINPKALHLILMTIPAYWWWPQEQMRKLRPGKAKITHWSSQSQKATGSAFEPRHVQLQITATSSFLSCPPDKFPPTLQVSDQM